MVDGQGKVEERRRGGGEGGVLEESSQVRVRPSEEMKAEAAEWRLRE